MKKKNESRHDERDTKKRDKYEGEEKKGIKQRGKGKRANNLHIFEWCL